MPEQQEQAEPKLSDKEALKILTSIVRGVSKDYSIQVKLLDKGDDDAYFNWKDRYVAIHKKNFHRDLDVLRGLAAHEGKHVEISVGDMIPVEDMQTDGFNGMFQMVEDVRVNSSTERDFPGAGEWIRKANFDFTKEGEERSLEEATKRLTGELGFTPRMLEWGTAVQNTWTIGEYGIPLNPDTKKALDLTVPALEKIKADVPLSGSKKSEFRESMWRNYVIQKTEIWPLYKELLEKDKKDIEDLQFIKYLASDEGEMELEIINMDLTDEERQELESIITDTREKFPKPPPEEPKPEENTNLSFMDLNKMSTNLRQKLDSARKQISEKKQKEFEDQAKKAMQDLEDEIVKALRPKLQDPKNNETHKERLLRLLQDAAFENAQKQAVKQQQEMPKPPDRASGYQDLLNQVSSEIDQLVDHLNDVLVPNKFPRWKRGYPTGQRLNLSSVMQYEADKRGYDRLWERKSLPKKKDYGLTLLLDLSLSMNHRITDANGIPIGNRLTEALKSVVIFSEALNRVGIPFEVLGYGTVLKEKPNGDMGEEHKLIVLKDYREQFGDDIRKKIGEVEVMYKTPTGWALDQTSQRIDSYGVKAPIIINVTDGDASDKAVLGVNIDKINQTNKKLIGLGIGEGIERAYIEGVYPNGKHIPDVKDLPVEMAQLLEAAIH